MTTEQNDAMAGMEAARKAVIALAEGDEGAALAALNGTTHGEAVNAAAYLLSALRESVSARVNDDPRRLELALKTAVSDVEDPVMTQVALIMRDAEKDLPD